MFPLKYSLQSFPCSSFAIHDNPAHMIRCMDYTCGQNLHRRDRSTRPSSKKTLVLSWPFVLQTLISVPNLLHTTNLSFVPQDNSSLTELVQAVPSKPKFSKGQPRIPTLPLNKRQFPRLCDAESEFKHYVFYPSQIFSEDGHLTSFSFYLSSVSAFDRWTILICYTFWQFHSPKVM